MERKVLTFFYGSYMNVDVLREVNLVPETWEVARLSGFDIDIRPRANLVRSDRYAVYGVVAPVSHPELARLYAHAHDVLGESYLPEAVIVEVDGSFRPALCYIATSMVPRPAADDYVDRVVRPARRFGFPAWYVDRLETFRGDAR